MKAVSVAGGVVVSNKGQILIVSHHGYDWWSLPKGHVEAGEDLLTAARREIYEESGVSRLEYVTELGSYERLGGKNFSELKHITIFLFKTPEQKLQPFDPHNPEARWVPKEEVVNFLTHKKDKEFWLSIKDRVEKFCDQE